MSNNIHTATRGKAEWCFKLEEIHAIKLDKKGGKIFGLHSGGVWLVLSEDIAAWDKLSKDWAAIHKSQSPFPGARK